MAFTPSPQELPLRDIHLPADIGVWPLAPGWWLLFGLLVLGGLAILWLIRYRQRRALRRSALRQLERLDVAEGQALAMALSRLLRQAALCHFERHEVAGLCSEAWLGFLDRPFTDAPFSAGVGRVLAEAPYRQEVTFDAVALRDLCRSWLKRLPPRQLSFWRGR